MPVVTRSCGRLGVRRRIEDPTPQRPAYTTIKRKKNQSDEETDKPAKKKANNRGLTVTVERLTSTPCEKQHQTSRIPRRCTVKSATNQIKETDKENREFNTRDENHETNEQDENNCQTNQRNENCPTNETNCKITPPPGFADISSTSSNSSPESDEFQHLTPVAARTRSFSALKKSYRAKKAQKNIANTNTAIDKACRVEKQSSNVDRENETSEPVNDPKQEVVSSTCEGKDDEIRELEDQEEIDASEKKTDDFYKAKFHQLIQHIKTIQENFESAQAVASKNIAAYDAHIKELTDSLEKEKTQVTTTVEELQITKEQLLNAQKELEQAKQQNTDVTVQTETLNAELEKAQELESKIKFYEMLSGIKLSQEQDSSQPLIESYCCVFKPAGLKGKAIKFRLVYDKEIDEVEFSPLVQRPSSEEFLQKLPRYLRENIYFSTDQATSFLLRLMQTTHKQQ